ncbi:MAG: hypothetical protein V2I67_08410 [Thermoanaerobaculales bacterium]|jgi:hypothetical protein|nr:hypothetical protein [Thermoanaerobaculales bacterium]
MNEWLLWARGPMFRFAIMLMMLGMVRLAALNLINLARVAGRSGDKRFPVPAVLRSTAGWLFPRGGALTGHPVFTLSSMIFHLAMIITPIFLGAHILLWERGLGLSWPALAQPLADTLTLAGIVTGLILIVQRMSARSSRDLSRFQDYLLPALITVIFATGYLAIHPGSDPLPYDTVMLIHVVCGNLLLIALPFSKLSHALLFPVTRLASEMGWHLAPDAGRRVAVALDKEDQPI